MVGGRGFEPGASRSRITRQPVQPCLFRATSVQDIAPWLPPASRLGPFLGWITTESAAVRRKRIAPGELSVGGSYRKREPPPSHALVFPEVPGTHYYYTPSSQVISSEQWNDSWKLLVPVAFGLVLGLAGLNYFRTRDIT